MTTIYAKAQDERTVISMRMLPGAEPKIPESMKRQGWVQIDVKEFNRLKRKIRKGGTVHASV